MIIDHGLHWLPCRFDLCWYRSRVLLCWIYRHKGDLSRSGRLFLCRTIVIERWNFGEVSTIGICKIAVVFLSRYKQIMLFTFHKNGQPYFEWKGEIKALFSIIGVHNRGHGKFAFSAEMVHNRVERIGKALCSPTVNLLRRGLLDHCMETEYGTIKWTSNVWLSDGYRPNDNICC